MPEVEFVKETWVYAGRRLDRDNKVFYCWASDLDVPESELWTFENLKAHAVGGLYEVDVFHSDLGTKVKKQMRFVSAAPSGHPIIDQWRLLDKAAETARLQASKERKAKEKSQDLGDLTLREVKVMMMTRSQSAAVLAMVIRYLGVA